MKGEIAPTGKQRVAIGVSAAGGAFWSNKTEAGSYTGVPVDLVRTGYAMSGVYDLAPLIGTSLNRALGLTEGTARAASPLFRPPSPKGRRFVAAVGGDESEEFKRQSLAIAENWRSVGIDARYEVLSGTNHFTIVDELITPGSPVLTQIVALAREADAA